MRIDLSNVIANQIASEQSPKKVAGQSAGSVDSTDSEDRTTLTSDSSSVSSLVSQAMSTPASRHELVSQLKQAVSSGKYRIDAEAIAASMVNERA